MLRDDGIPRPLRWLGALGLLPIPGPVDEAVLLLVALVLFVFYRQRLRDAWGAASRSRAASAGELGADRHDVPDHDEGGSP